MLSKPPPYPPLGPLTTSISALRTGAVPQASSWWTWAPAAHSLPVPSSDSTPAKWFQTLYTLSDERSAAQLQSFLVGGRASSTASDRSTRSSTFIARVHYLCTSVYLITWIVYLCILRTHHYDVMVGCWFTGQGKKGDCVGKKVNGGPVSVPLSFFGHTSKPKEHPQMESSWE